MAPTEKIDVVRNKHDTAVEPPLQDRSFRVWLRVDILEAHLSLCYLEPLECFVTEELYPFASNYVPPPSFSISTLCVYM